MQRLASAARLCVKCTAQRPVNRTVHPSINRIQSKFSALSFHTSALARSDQYEKNKALEDGAAMLDQLNDENCPEEAFTLEESGVEMSEERSIDSALEDELEMERVVFKAIDEMDDRSDEEIIAERDQIPAEDSFGYNEVNHPDGSVEFDVNRAYITQHFDDPTVYSDNMDHISERLDRDQPLTTTQKITLMKKWLADIETNPRTAFEAPHPMVTWSHPNNPESRPAFHPPRFDEQFVRYDFDPAIVKSMSAEETRKARRGSVSEWILERKVYENKMHDVRKFYMAEYQQAKQRRDARILNEWTANKAAKEVKSRERRALKAVHAIATREREKVEFEQRLLNKRARAASRIHRDAQLEERKAHILARMLQERKQSWINTDESNTDWGVKIDDSLFHKTETNITGFWPARKAEE